jgi:hypothetical protein
VLIISSLDHVESVITPNFEGKSFYTR